MESKLEDIRTELDPETKGTVPIDTLVEWLNKQLEEYLNE